jgi:hypothetical protein
VVVDTEPTRLPSHPGPWLPPQHHISPPAAKPPLSPILPYITAPLCSLRIPSSWTQVGSIPLACSLAPKHTSTTSILIEQG